MGVRPAISTDYDTFARLFPELRVPDAVPSAEKFEREMMPTTFIAERDGRAVGIACWQILRCAGYLRILISDPAVRRTGVGRELMTAVRDRFREAACESFSLNVLPANAAAIALYESFGLSKAWHARSLHLDWSLLDGRPSLFAARVIEPDDDAHVEHERGILPGQLADARGMGRVLRMIERSEQITGAAVFDPTFPGAYPFRAETIDDAVSLLHALRPHARPADAGLAISTEDQEALADALVDLGAKVRVETMHMRGPLGVVVVGAPRERRPVAR
jgi:GNAT superfamily N-acetyltransferase